MSSGNAGNPLPELWFVDVDLISGSLNDGNWIPSGSGGFKVNPKLSILFSFSEFCCPVDPSEDRDGKDGMLEIPDDD